LYARVSQFFQRTIWDARLDELAPSRALGYRAARIVQRVLDALLLGEVLHVRAAALTYFTVLSLVPMLAFGFALLKGLGAYEALVEAQIRPYLLDLLSGNAALRAALERILRFVENTDVASLGFVGLLAMLYAATRLLHNIEAAFNEVWGVVRGRSLLQQFRDYLLIMVVTPLSLIAGAALTAVGQTLPLLRSAGDAFRLGDFVGHVVSLIAPLLVLFVGLLFLYKVLPYTRVRLGSAAVGAAIGAVVWYAVLVAHVRFQVGVARFNALYSSFAAIPIFLAWLQVSWLVVLVGAQTAATSQNSRLLAQRMRLAHSDHMVREAMGLAAMLQIGRAFVRGTKAPSVQALGAQLDVHVALLHELLEKLSAAGLIARALPENEPCYMLARPLASIRVKDVFDALRGAKDKQERGEALRRVPRVASELWWALDRAASESEGNRSLDELIRQDG
jgi:membrane protein